MSAPNSTVVADCLVEITWLRALCAVARTRSFSRAAAALSYSQPAVSQHVLALERRLGRRLVDRSMRPVRLTADGVRVAAVAEEVLGRLDDLQHLGPERDEVSDLVIASFPSAAATLVPLAIQRLVGEMPSVTVQLHQHEPADALRAVRVGRADVAIVHDYPGASALDAAGLRRTDLLVEGFRWVLPRDDRLSRSAAIDSADLATRDWIGTLRGGPARGFNDMLRVVGRQEGFAPRVQLETDDTQVAQGMVAAGLGVLLLPELALQAPHPGIRHRPVAGFNATRRVSVLQRDGRPSPAAEALTTALIAAATRLPGI